MPKLTDHEFYDCDITGAEFCLGDPKLIAIVLNTRTDHIEEVQLNKADVEVLAKAFGLIPEVRSGYG